MVKVDVMVKERPKDSRASGSGSEGAGGPGPEVRETEPDRKGARSKLAVQPRRERYMVTALPQHLLPPGVPELSMDAVCDRLERMPEVNVTRRLRPSEKLQSAGLPPSCPEIAVVEAPEAQLPAMRTLHVHIEPDLPLSGTGPAAAPAAGVLPLRDPGLILPLEQPVEISLRVCDPDGEPLAGAAVFLIGSSWPGQGVSAADGTVTVTLPTETVQSIQSLYVRPAGGYADRWINRPDLSATQENLVTLTPLSKVYPGLDDRQQYGWGQQAMRLDRLPPTFRAFGIKVGVIGSGVAAEHPDLKQRVRSGIDLVRGTEEGWAQDTVGTGTHAAGVIAGADTGKGVIGTAVDAEIEVCQVLPGGCFSDLIAAMDHCIEHEVDVAHIAVATPYPSALVSRKLADANAAGIACVAPAGDTGGPVCFPGSLPTVFTVGALGVFGSFPPDTSQATHVGPQLTPEGLFAPPFSCYGPGVDAAAPGVAVLSCSPQGGYTALDGTGTASAHVAGLAALVLAHHEDFHGQLLPRGPGRVQHLFEIIAASCRQLAAPGTMEAARVGRGLPDALVALGLAPGVQLAPALSPYTPSMAG
ncbi:S8 family serine peptidase [Streptomyces sp. ISL-22]|uniref:Subtilisin, serine endopeptidase n=2 Tax=Streptomyces TaxID=1883 RepID=A0A117NTJ4_9ACTN|nr:Subtilisin, serine endopeptidase [Streptomyces curacoi]MBT2419045.1 S8 family serine peptidase [Streptomyces sp. ISL-24]MBT2437670.1 S8 family serine peptidase [Streptomyces sp. ISL-22]